MLEVQQRRVQLLAELDGICRKNNIPCFLIWRTLWQAMRGPAMEDPAGDVAVAVRAEDCLRLIEAVERERAPDRYLESMHNNGNYFRFCLRYGDSGSLDFPVNFCGCFQNYGIHITVNILRQAGGSGGGQRRRATLETGWENCVHMPKHTPQIARSRFVVKALRFLLGPKRAGRVIFRALLKAPKRNIKPFVYLRLYHGRRIDFPEEWFADTVDVELEGHRLQAPVEAELFLRDRYGAKWKTRKFPLTAIDPTKRILDPHMPFREYLERMRESGVDPAAIWRDKQRSDRRYSKALALNEKVDGYWDLMQLCGDRFEMWQLLVPQKAEIVRLHQEGNYIALQKLLRPYIAALRKHHRRNLGLCFDKEIFEAAMALLANNGETILVGEICRMVPEKHWLPIAM